MHLPVDFAEPLRRGIATMARRTPHACSILIPQGGVTAGIMAGTFATKEEDETICDPLRRGMVCFSRSKRVTNLLVSRGWKVDLECVVASYHGSRFPEHEISGVSYRWLTVNDFPVVVATYHNVGEAYVRERLEQGVLLGTYVDGNLAGYIGLHQEGTLGMLMIFPEFRRRHLATELEKRYCNILIDRGDLPFCDIVVGNDASVRLHARLGFSFERLHCWWLS
jgi:hypothetical protein